MLLCFYHVIRNDRVLESVFAYNIHSLYFSPFPQKTNSVLWH